LIILTVYIRRVQKILWDSNSWINYIDLTKYFVSACISASTRSKIKSKDSSEKLIKCRFWNWPYFLNLIKIWGRVSDLVKFDLPKYYKYFLILYKNDQTTALLKSTTYTHAIVSLLLVHVTYNLTSDWSFCMHVRSTLK